MFPKRRVDKPYASPRPVRVNKPKDFTRLWRMLQKSSEIVLDTSRKLRIISHTEWQPAIENVLKLRDAALFYSLSARLYLTRK